MKFAYMHGQAVNKYFAPLAAGAQAVYTAGTPAGPAYWQHSDWLGSARLGSTVSQSSYGDQAYAPFGETYNVGIPGATLNVFTGQTSDMGATAGTSPIYDFLFRQYSATQGRWMTPDPAGMGAVDITNPQTWNRYAYVANNPLNSVDPSGLYLCTTDNEGNVSCDGAGDGSGGGGCAYDSCVYGTSDPGPSPDPIYGGDQNCASGMSIDGLCQDQQYTFYTTAIARLGPVKNTPAKAPNNPTRLFLPPNALTCTGMGKQFYAPPQFNLGQVVSAGQAGGRFNLSAMNSAVGHFGTFDYQRVGTPSSFTFYSGYTPVSNIDVGAYLYGAGFSQSQAGMISNTFASLFSKNAGDPNQAIYRNLGYQMAAGKGSYSCSAIPQ